MTKLTDGRQTVAISMQIWDGRGFLPDFSNDFFNVGSLPRTEDSDAYSVKDVCYCIDQAFDWANYKGDFFDPESEAYNKENGFARRVIVEAA